MRLRLHEVLCERSPIRSRLHRLNRGSACRRDEPAKKQGWFQRLKAGLTKTSSRLSQDIAGIFTKRKLDADTLEELEELLIQADLGVDTAMRITAALAKGRHNREISPEEVRAVLAAEVELALAPVAKPLQIDGDHRPHVVLVVGVNGTGKTTTIGKLAHRLRQEGKAVMLAAGDTFRAAAIDQLKIWGERTGAEVVARSVGADSAGLAFDALTRAREQKCDVLLIDTAGRLQNKQVVDGRTRKGASRPPQGRSERTAPGAACAGRDNRSKRPEPGGSFQG